MDLRLLLFARAKHVSCRSRLAGDEALEPCGDLEIAIAGKPAPTEVWFGRYFTAPKDRPRTSCFWLIQPKIRIGAQARVDTADNLAQNKPSGLE